MTKKQFNKEINKIAKSLIKQGWTIEINEGLPYVAIDSPEGEEYSWFFQGEEAEELLRDIPDWIEYEDYYLLWKSQGW